MKKFTLPSLVIIALLSHSTSSKETNETNYEQVTTDLIHSLVSIKSDTNETIDFTGYDDSNWMAIVDLVQASEMQLVYTASLQEQFTESANSFFTELESEADKAPKNPGKSEADSIRKLINGFIEKIQKVYDKNKAEIAKSQQERE